MRNYDVNSLEYFLEVKKETSDQMLNNDTKRCPWHYVANQTCNTACPVTKLHMPNPLPANTYPQDIKLFDINNNKRIQELYQQLAGSNKKDVRQQMLQLLTATPKKPLQECYRRLLRMLESAIQSQNQRSTQVLENTIVLLNHQSSNHELSRSTSTGNGSSSSEGVTNNQGQTYNMAGIHSIHSNIHNKSSTSSNNNNNNSSINIIDLNENLEEEEAWFIPLFSKAENNTIREIFMHSTDSTLILLNEHLYHHSNNNTRKRDQLDNVMQRAIEYIRIFKDKGIVIIPYGIISWFACEGRKSITGIDMKTHLMSDEQGIELVHKTIGTLPDETAHVKSALQRKDQMERQCDLIRDLARKDFMKRRQQPQPQPHVVDEFNNNRKSNNSSHHTIQQQHQQQQQSQRTSVGNHYSNHHNNSSRVTVPTTETNSSDMRNYKRVRPDQEDERRKRSRYN